MFLKQLSVCLQKRIKKNRYTEAAGAIVGLHSFIHIFESNNITLVLQVWLYTIILISLQSIIQTTTLHISES